MAIYCWGSTVHGQLGLGGIEDEQILTPRQMDWPDANEIIKISCGNYHTLLLGGSGKLYSCGCNDVGQLGHELTRKRPQIISGLENYVITDIACGGEFSLAINNWGQTFSWGSNAFGQLGRDAQDFQSTPKIIKALATKHIVQIAAGYTHCMALANNGELYTWGANNFGQLGIGKVSRQENTPQLVKSLAGIPIGFISCGGNHSFVISKSGAVFGWGKNTFGQLGLNDDTHRSHPTQLKTMRNLGVRYIACGDDFSVFLTMGTVFTCGNGNFGQLGHGVLSNEILPRSVFELMGSPITQIVCGRHHTLVLAPTRGRVYGFGLGGSGQLGTKGSGNASVPQVVLGPWVSPSGSSLFDIKEKEKTPPMVIYRIFAGGDHSLASTTEVGKRIASIDYRIPDPNIQILTLTEDLAMTCSKQTPNDTVDLDLIATVEIIFKNQACINASFLLENNEHYGCTSKHHGVNIDAAEKTFEFIRKVENPSIKQIIWDGVTNDLVSSLLPSPADVETLRIYLILPLYHEFINSKNYKDLHTPFSQALNRLNKIPAMIVHQWWANQSKDYFERLVEIFKGVVSHIITFNFLQKEKQRRNRNPEEKILITYEENLFLALNVMHLCFRINHTQRVDNKIPYDVFHLPELTDTIDLQRDYLQWLMDGTSQGFHLCNFPFIFDPKAKHLLLQTDQHLQMQSAMQNATATGFQLAFSGIPTTITYFIFLQVSRENIVEDTIRELSQYGSSDLKKPLRVKFHNEEAEDAGGVRKEFFMLLLKDLLDPKYGMFKEYPETRTIWFSEDSFEGEQMFRLIGIICGLAIYNFTIINLPFPLALYKKLLQEPLTLNDLKDLTPTVANSLQQILDYNEEDFESVFCLTFDLTREVYGEVKTVLLKANGDKIPVTQENKTEFVDLYIDFIFNKSIEKHYKGFHEGFNKVCGGRVLELFQSHELMAVVVGNEDYDWHALEASAEYKNGYTSGDQTIRWFWEVFHDLPLAEKKKFLLYLTGSDRIPITGMKSIKIYIQPTFDDKFLPVAHTCFNLLDLPRYKTKERLKYKLLQAIQQTQGFSLV